MENECRNLVFLLFLTSRVDLFVKKIIELPESFADSQVLYRGYYMATKRYKISLRVLKNIS